MCVNIAVTNGDEPDVYFINVKLHFIASWFMEYNSLYDFSVRAKMKKKEKNESRSIILCFIHLIKSFLTIQ